MSASRIVEQVEELELTDEEELSSVDEFQDMEEAPQEQPQPYKIPEKFVGKSLEDVVRAYEDSEKAYGRQAQEVGELRKLTDKLLNLQLNDEGKKKQEEVKQPVLDVNTLLDNPEEALNRAVASNPRIKALEQQLLQEALSKSKQKFESEHPDWKDIVESESFKSWVTSSPVRLKMFNEADKKYDYQTGSELFNLYKQIHGASQQEAEVKRKKSLKAASVEKGTTGKAPVKVYRRADLINLRINNPAKYEAMQDEIMEAYAQGRVR